jgi:hypothetical protein
MFGPPEWAGDPSGSLPVVSLKSETFLLVAANEGKSLNM